MDDEQRRSVDNKNEFTLLRLIMLVCLFIQSERQTERREEERVIAKFKNTVRLD